MPNSNVVSVRFSTPESRSPINTGTDATADGETSLVPFPVRSAKAPESLPFDARKTIRGTFAWAAEVVAADRRLSFAIVEARKLVNRLMRETCPKPSFTPGDSDRAAFEEAMSEWETTRRQLSIGTGLAAMTAEWVVIQKDAHEAHAILRAAGTDPVHDRESGEPA